MTDTPEDAMDNQTDIGNIQNTPANSDAGSGSPRPQTSKSDSEHMDEWLNSILVEIKNDHNITCEIRVREYLDITITRRDDRRCWLESGSIDLACALLAKRSGRKDVCALTIQHGVDLFWVGWGTSKMSELLKDSIIEPALKDKKKRFIVVPVNDGPLHHARAEAKKHKKDQANETNAENAEKESAKEVKESNATKVQEDSAQDEHMLEESTDLQRAEEDTIMHDAIQESDSKEPERDLEEVEEMPTEQRAFGTHWGLLVIDKKERKARWIDSCLTLTNSRKYPGRKRISIISEAATVAGKILCGIEQVLGSERGRFDAKTAKYVPHQADHNRFKGDPGACCGPYVFAFLEYLYKHPAYMERLRTAFGFEKWNKHCEDMDFDSLYTRVAMQKIIQDKSEDDPRSDELSLKMTPDVFRILQPKVLAPWVSTAYRSHKRKPDVKGRFDRFDFRKHDRDSNSRGNRPGGGGGGGDGGGGNGGSAPPPPGPPKEVYDTDEDDDNDDFIYNPSDLKNSTTSKKALRVVIREQPDHYVGIKTKRLAYERAYETAAERARAAEHKTKTAA